MQDEGDVLARPTRATSPDQSEPAGRPSKWPVLAPFVKLNSSRVTGAPAPTAPSPGGWDRAWRRQR